MTLVEPIYTKKEVEAILNVPSITVTNLLAKGKLSHFIVAKRVRVSRTQLDSYLSSVEVKLA